MTSQGVKLAVHLCDEDLDGGVDGSSRFCSSTIRTYIADCAIYVACLGGNEKGSNCISDGRSLPLEPVGASQLLACGQYLNFLGC